MWFESCFLAYVEEEVCVIWFGKPHSTYFFLNSVSLLDQVHSSDVRKIYVLCGLPNQKTHTSSSKDSRNVLCRVVEEVCAMRFEIIQATSHTILRN